MTGTPPTRLLRNGWAWVRTQEGTWRAETTHRDPRLRRCCEIVPETTVDGRRLFYAGTISCINVPHDVVLAVILEHQENTGS